MTWYQETGLKEYFWFILVGYFFSGWRLVLTLSALSVSCLLVAGLRLFFFLVVGVSFHPVGTVCAGFLLSLLLGCAISWSFVAVGSFCDRFGLLGSLCVAFGSLRAGASWHFCEFNFFGA